MLPADVTAEDIIRLMEDDEQIAQAREYVARGAARLDEYHLGRDWVRRVRWTQLDMGSHLHCVLGQLFGNFPAGVDALRIVMDEWHAFGFDAEFDPGADNTPAHAVSYPALHAAWLEVRDAVG